LAQLTWLTAVGVSTGGPRAILKRVIHLVRFGWNTGINSGDSTA